MTCETCKNEMSSLATQPELTREIVLSHLNRLGKQPGVVVNAYVCVTCLNEGRGLTLIAVREDYYDQL